MKVNNYITPLLGMCFLALLLLVPSQSLLAGEYIILNMRLYEAATGDQAPVPTVVTTSVTPYTVGNITSSKDMQKEIDKLKGVYNVSNIQLMMEIDWTFITGYPPKLFRVFKMKNNTFGILLTREKKDNNFSIEIYEGKNRKIKENNLLEATTVLKEKNTVIFGFKDKKDNIFFLSFHRESNVEKVVESVDPVRISTQYKRELKHYVRPEYPQDAREKGIEGRVSVRAYLASSGEVVEVKYLSGPKELADVALNAVKKWKYAPVEMKDGQRIPLTVIVAFNLTSKSKKSMPVDLIGSVMEMTQKKGIKGVTVQAENKVLNIRKVTQSDSNGFYGFMALPAGQYSITFKREGYMTLRINNSLATGGKTYKTNVLMKKKN